MIYKSAQKAMHRLVYMALLIKFRFKVASFFHNYVSRLIVNIKMVVEAVVPFLYTNIIHAVPDVGQMRPCAS
jgi:hypothetical protein